MRLMFTPSIALPGQWYCKKLNFKKLGSWVWPWEVRAWLQEKIDENSRSQSKADHR